MQEHQTLWIYGYVRYRDFLGSVWRSKFCVTFPHFDGRLEFTKSNVYPMYAGREQDDQAQRADHGHGWYA